MATRRQKSEDDIRKQVDNIYRNAVLGLSSGKYDSKTFNSRLDMARNTEKRYLSNIEKQSRFKKENAESYKIARATKYSRMVYMTGNNG